MRSSAPALHPTEAATQLGVSVKTLRLYEQRGLMTPPRSASGWRVYGHAEMARAAEILALRALGLSLDQVRRVLQGGPEALEPALAAHQTALETKVRECNDMVDAVRRLRSNLTGIHASDAGESAQCLEADIGSGVSFDLPWPWGGERFALHDIAPLTYITGPLGSGKTRFAMRLAESLPDAMFLGLDRLADNGAAALRKLEAEPALKPRIDALLAALEKDGATVSESLLTLLAGIEAQPSSLLVIDMVEQGLDGATQTALMAHLRCRTKWRRLALMTRSSSILDMTAMGTDEMVILCPANHSPPVCVRPVAGAPGYEVVANCLASPEVRARTQGVIAWRQQVS